MYPFPKTAIVTGASGWIGQAIAQRLAREGTKVVLVARKPDPLRELAARIEATGGRAAVVSADLADISGLGALFDASVRELGAVDMLVNNAGVEDFQHFHTHDPGAISTAVDINLKAPLILMRHAIAHMREREAGGVIVNISSTAGLVGTPYGVVYSANKSALRMATASVRMEYAGTGVRASVICPGFVVGGGMHEEQRKVAGDAPNMLGHTTAEDVAEAVVRAARKDVPEIIVNSRPMRPLLPLERISPSLGQKVTQGLSGSYMRRIADERAARKK